jgi:hypothetical protein
MDCKTCKWFKECAVRQLCLPVKYCQYVDVNEFPNKEEE